MVLRCRADRPLSQTIVLTGCASGIGAATRTRLEAAGHSIIGVDLRDAEIVADLSTDDGRERAVAEAVEACGGVLDGLVTCAGVSAPVAADVILQVNWFGSRVFLDGLRPALAASEGIAKAVAISSNSATLMPNIPEEGIDALFAGDVAEPLRMANEGWDASSIAYGISKTAVARYVRRNAPTPDWAGAGIRLNSVAPGAVMTPLLQGGLDDPMQGELIAGLQIPSGGFGEPDQLAQWIEILLSDAADFMVGSVVFVDGGSDAQIRGDAWPRTYTM